MTIIKCKSCNNDFNTKEIKDYKSNMYCSLHCRNKFYNNIGLNRLNKASKINKEFIEDYKKDKYCVKCNYKSYPIILEFHHINPNEKNTGINILMKRLAPIEIIKEEINKCILICPNCHRELHLKDKFQ